MPLVPATEPAKPKELCRDFAKAKCSAGDRCPRLHASKAEASITKPTELVDKLERHTLSLHTSDSAPNKPKTTGSTPNLVRGSLPYLFANLFLLVSNYRASRQVQSCVSSSPMANATLVINADEFTPSQKVRKRRI